MGPDRSVGHAAEPSAVEIECELTGLSVAPLGRSTHAGLRSLLLGLALLLGIGPISTRLHADERSPRPSPGCLQPAVPQDQSIESGLDGAGVTRSFEVHRPARFDPAAPPALVFVFHGAGGHASDAMAFGLEDAEGARNGGVFVFPQGRDFERNGIGWDDRCGGYDMVFFDRMVAAIAARSCIDMNRIFVAGFSWGCDFVTALACCRGTTIRAVAAAACSDDFREASDPGSYLNRACPVPSGAAIRFSHQAGGDPAYPAPLFATTSRLFRGMNGCSNEADPADQEGCRSFRGCRQEFIECARPAIGHSVGPDWAQRTWTFFTGNR